MSRAHGLSCIKRSSQSGFVHGLSPFAATVIFSMFCDLVSLASRNLDGSENTTSQRRGTVNVRE